MITNFIKEYHAYSGPYSAAGFKNSDPMHKYRLTMNVKYKPENEEFFKNIFDKYTIPFDEETTSLTIVERKRKFFKGPQMQLLDLTFFAYNVYEANAIIDIILKEIVDIKLKFDPDSFDVIPSVDIILNKEKHIGFNKKTEL